jgi:hypothetical protein
LETSFESTSFNIYDPVFTSEESLSPDKVLSGMRMSNVEYLERLSEDETSPFDESNNSFLLLSPDDVPTRKIEAFKIEPIRVIKLDNFMSGRKSPKMSSGYCKYQEIKNRKTKEQRKKKSVILPKLFT